jgi:hypothetical protein
MMTTTMRFLLALGFLQASFGQDDYTPRCADCWCVPEGGTTDGTCPEYPDGLWQSFPPSWWEILPTFTLTSDAIVLQTATGETDCYPFFDAIGPQGYSKSKFPQCQRSLLASDEAVCAYKYSEGQACRGREYEMQTYAAANVAVQDGAYVIHLGACGVCSNAQDLAARFKTFDTLNSQSIFCAAAHLITKNFPALLQCYQNLGFTDECSLLWSHFGATNGELCTTTCIPDPEAFQIELNEPPPFCALSPCLNCSASQFETDFNILGGMFKSGQNSGFNDEIASSCDAFYLIDNHDPCVDSAPTLSPAPSTAVPTMSPVSAASDRDVSVLVIVAIVSPILLLIGV